MDPTLKIGDLQKSAELVRSAQSCVALTGAGISTPSGIPDFRSPGTGLWELVDPFSVASLASFRYHPERFYEWVQPLVERILRATPNPAHLALAELEKAGYLSGVITQNIDDLHHRAGSQLVYEVHGHLREATCGSCYRTYDSRPFIEHYLLTCEIPTCEHCGSILKPNVVLIGEQLPFSVVQDARAQIDHSDLIIIAGSSLEITPVATFPITPLDKGAGLIIINHEPTYLDRRADFIFREDVASVLPRLVEEVLSGV